DRPAVAAASVMGGGPGTRGVSQLAPGTTVERVDAIALSGGSAFGLDAAGGVMDWLRARGRGFAVGSARVPIVPGAIIFDLLTGTADDPTGWDDPPWWRLSRQAAAAATPASRIAEGNHGAGLGATAGALKGGTGTASIRIADVAAVAPGATIAALVIANPLGQVTLPGSNAFMAHPYEVDGEFGAVAPPHPPPPPADHPFERFDTGANTSLVVVATDLTLTREQCLRVALMAQDGLARAVRPAHSPLDGDTVFALSTERHSATVGAALLARVGMLAADCVSRATARAVYHAEPLAGFPAWRDLAPDGTLSGKSPG
ncbi:MAG: P1 family peptidase, partial [Pseudomonadota bacterium]